MNHINSPDHNAPTSRVLLRAVRLNGPLDAESMRMQFYFNHCIYPLGGRCRFYFMRLEVAKNSKQTQAICMNEHYLLLIDGLSSSAVMGFVSVFTLMESKRDRLWRFVQKDEASIADCSSGLEVLPGVLLHDKLSKRFMMSLPAGLSVVIPGIDGKPRWAATIHQNSIRLGVWQAAVRAKMAGRKCYVLWPDRESAEWNRQLCELCSGGSGL